MLIATLSYCASSKDLSSHEPMSQDEQIKATTRVYRDISPEFIFSAADKLLVRSNETEFQFSRSPGSLTAELQRSVYNSNTSWQEWHEIWVVTAQEQKEEVLVSVNVERQITHLFGNETQTPYGPAVYDLFWDRLEFLLGLRDKWVTCEESQDNIRQGKTRGHVNWLCRVKNEKKRQNFWSFPF
jgi:hypothetical protein